MLDQRLPNRFLVSLSTQDRDSILALSTPVDLPQKQVLYEAGEPLSHAYFLTSGIASVVTSMPDGSIAEVGMIGAEGFVGSVQLLGSAPVLTDCMIQLDATALRIRLRDLRELFRSSEGIRDATLNFVQQQILSLGQIAACHRLHEAEERLARWLLMAQDRAQLDTLDFTQEFLAQMLGARRSTVTVVAGSLQRSGLIEYRRGQVQIINRLSLEDAACDCYPLLKSIYERLYRPLS